MIAYDDKNSAVEESGFLELQIKVIHAFVGISERVFLVHAIRCIIRFMERDGLQDDEVWVSLSLDSLQCLVVENMVRSCVKDVFFLILKTIFADDLLEFYS